MKFDEVVAEVMLRRDGSTHQWRKDQYGESVRLDIIRGTSNQRLQVEPKVKP